MSLHVPNHQPCPACGELMPPQLPYCPSDWKGADEYDHYWCKKCDEFYDIEEFQP